MLVTSDTDRSIRAQHREYFGSWGQGLTRCDPLTDSRRFQASDPALIYLITGELEPACSRKEPIKNATYTAISM
jgi:hypothetical protein